MTFSARLGPRAFASWFRDLSLSRQTHPLTQDIIMKTEAHIARLYRSPEHGSHTCCIWVTARTILFKDFWDPQSRNRPCVASSEALPCVARCLCPTDWPSYRASTGSPVTVGRPVRLGAADETWSLIPGAPAGGVDTGHAPTAQGTVLLPQSCRQSAQRGHRESQGVTGLWQQTTLYPQRGGVRGGSMTAFGFASHRRRCMLFSL